MDSFETLVAGLLRRKGYWIWPSYKVELTKEEKRFVGRPSSPRWEIDILAYKGATNEILAVECKSFLDSPGVSFEAIAAPRKENRYKLFNDEPLRTTVFRRLVMQLLAAEACRPEPVVRLALATGHIRSDRDREAIRKHFVANDWQLWDDHWVANELRAMSAGGYEDEPAALVAKLVRVGLGTSEWE